MEPFLAVCTAKFSFLTDSVCLVPVRGETVSSHVLNYWWWDNRRNYLHNGGESEHLPGKGRGESPWLVCCSFTQTPLFVSALNLGPSSLGQLVSPVLRTWEQYAGRNACCSSQFRSTQGSHFCNHRDHVPELSHPWTRDRCPSFRIWSPLLGHCCGGLWYPWVFLYKPFSSWVPLSPNAPPLPRKATFPWSFPTLP